MVTCIHSKNVFKVEIFKYFPDSHMVYGAAICINSHRSMKQSAAQAFKIRYPYHSMKKTTCELI